MIEARLTDFAWHFVAAPATECDDHGSLCPGLCTQAPCNLQTSDSWHVQIEHKQLRLKERCKPQHGLAVVGPLGVPAGLPQQFTECGSTVGIVIENQRTSQHEFQFPIGLLIYS
ncbi:hypothetical protein D9M68_396120 [compost metagenome]